MLFFAVDDEENMLSALHEAIAQAQPEADIEDYSTAAQVLAAIRQEGKRPEVVFSDVRLPGMDGLSLAVQIKNAAPRTKIVFVTAYSEYAVEAYRRHVNGYILKPVEPEMIRQELDALELPAVPAASNKLQIRCFGHFEVFWQGKPFHFTRSKAKELLAYLIDREGQWCSSEEIITALWEDATELKDARHYLRVLSNELAHALREIGQEEVLLRRRGLLAVDRERLDCDYYRMKAGDVGAVNAYQGKYMADYSWAEMTTGWLEFRK